jgi:hypothetical protein
MTTTCSPRCSGASETLMQLLQRLDAALLRALEHDEFTDEING